MQEEERKPKTQPAGAMPPPRPPTRTAIGLSPAGDDDDSIRRRRKKDTVRITLRPKLSAVRTIKLPTLPMEARTVPVIVTVKKLVAGLANGPSVRSNNLVLVILVFVLQATLVFEAFTSVDRTTSSLFLFVAAVLSIHVQALLRENRPCVRKSVRWS
jgi:hypothetical protein